ncbi:uncharacterized protein TNCV_179911 [Trichonephila clavipes]|nr:uncharacterized protein TNCV_179911 [Trichonephila clavipes]
MVLKANNRRTSCPCHDEFRGPRSDYVRQVAPEEEIQQIEIRGSLRPSNRFRVCNSSTEVSKSSLFGTFEFRKSQLNFCLPSGILVSDTDCCVLGSTWDCLGSNPGEDMDICKCIVPSWHWGTLNNRRASSPLVRLVEGEEVIEATGEVRGLKPSAKSSENEAKRTVTCMVLKATANDRRHLALGHDEFRGP